MALPSLPPNLQKDIQPIQERVTQAKVRSSRLWIESKGVKYKIKFFALLGRGRIYKLKFLRLTS